MRLCLTSRKKIPAYFCLRAWVCNPTGLAIALPVLVCLILAVTNHVFPKRPRGPTSALHLPLLFHWLPFKCQDHDMHALHTGSLQLHKEARPPSRRYLRCDFCSP